MKPSSRQTKIIVVLLVILAAVLVLEGPVVQHFRDHTRQKIVRWHELHTLGIKEIRDGNFDSAKTVVMEAMRIAHDLNLHYVADTHYLLGTLYYSVDDYANAIRHYRDALDAEERSGRPDVVDLMRFMDSIAETSYFAGDYANARRYAEDSLARKRVDFAHLDLLVVRNSIAKSLSWLMRISAKEQDWDSVLSYGAELVNVTNQFIEDELSNLGRSFHRMAKAHEHVGNREAAGMNYQRAVDTLKMRSSNQDEIWASVVKDYSTYLHSIGRTEEAVALESSLDASDGS